MRGLPAYPTDLLPYFRTLVSMISDEGKGKESPPLTAFRGNWYIHKVLRVESGLPFAVGCALAVPPEVPEHRGRSQGALAEKRACAASDPSEDMQAVADETEHPRKLRLGATVASQTKTE